LATAYQPNFERMEIAFRGGTPDRVPLYESTSAPFMSKYLGRPAVTFQDTVDFRLAAGYDYASVRVDIDFAAGIEAKEGMRQTQDPSGAQRKWAPEGAGQITSWEDFEKHPWPKAEDVNYRELEVAAKSLPDGMKLLQSRGHIFTDVSHLMGFETFSMAIFEQPDLVGAIFDKVGSVVYSIYDALSSFEAVGGVVFPDDLAYKGGLLVSPQVYRRWLFPWMRKIIILCQRSKPFIFHTDGNILKVWDDIVDMGVDVLHPMDPTGMDIRAAKARAAGKLCIMGNVNQAFPLGMGTPADVELEVLGLLRDVAPGGGYCLSSSNSVQENVPVENFRAMTETVLKWGKYPIDIPVSAFGDAERRAAASQT
jgi:uroporphyrinogen decarboxylase